MFDQEFARFLLQLGVGGILAGILFFFYRKDVRSYTELWREQSTLNAAMTTAMMAVVKDNTAALVTNTEVLKSLHLRIDRLDVLKFVSDDEAARLLEREQRPGGGRRG
jgi:predicted nucleic acid-binding OB-fold protein